MNCYSIYITVFLVLSVRESYQNSSSMLREKNSFLRNDLLNGKTHLREKIPPIIGGGLVMNIEDSSFVAQLIQEDPGGGKGLCGASILNEKYLLTVAHCIKDCQTPPFNKEYPANEYTIYAGGLSIKKSSFKSKVSSFFVHKKYVCRQHQRSRFTNLNDIAVVKIKRKFRFTRKINNIQLPSTSGSTTRHNFKQCVAYGWGRTSIHFSADLNNRLLKAAGVEIADYEECPFEINESTQICKIDSQNMNGSCRGDSEGPLVCDGVLVGVESYGDTLCRPKESSVSTRVKYFVGWINDIIKGNKNGKISQN